MKPVANFLSYFNCPQASIRTLFLTLGLLLVLCSSFIPAKYQQLRDVKPGWLTPSASGMEKLATYNDNADPNSDLHLHVRKQTKVKCAKKLSPNGLTADRSSDTEHVSTPVIAGFSKIERPAYYIFLFRYTLF